jgi:hypothetical protein
MDLLIEIDGCMNGQIVLRDSLRSMIAFYLSIAGADDQFCGWSRGGPSR